MKKSEAPQDIYQLKITLLGAKPPIWRRILAPAGMSLEQLHTVIQTVMGWEECHLHEFSSGKQRYGQPDEMDSFMGGPGVRSERSTFLFQVLRARGAKLKYTYDFGDDWEHAITLEKKLTPGSGRSQSGLYGGRWALSSRGLRRVVWILQSGRGIG